MPRLAERLNRRLAQLAPALALAAAVAIGGASQGASLRVGVLEAAGAVVLIWCALDARRQPIPRAARPLLILFATFAAFVLLQLTPTPYALWSMLPGRGPIAADLDLVGAAPRFMPLSLAPSETWSGLWRFLPPLAAFVLGVTVSWRALTRFLPWAPPLLGAASVGLGCLQLFAGPESGLYLYDPTNRGQPVGFFANVNHHATFLLMALPFLAVLARRLRRDWSMGDADLGAAFVLATIGGALMLGVMMASSGAAYLLTPPALVLSYLVFADGAPKRTDLALVAVGAVMFAALARIVASSPLLSNLGLDIVASADAGALSRPVVYGRVLDAIGRHFPLGSGLGSFERLYPASEDPAAVTSTYVNQAHNDYLQIALETGLPGAIIVALALAWCGRSAIGVWRMKRGAEGAAVKKAATIALGLALTHSLVDYPLRTAAIAVFTALCLAMICATPGSRGAPARAPRTAEDDAAPSRRVEI